MRITTRTSQILSAAAIIFASAIWVQAANTIPSTPTPASGQNATAESSEVTTLRSALALLRGADHDYQGHRAIAMQKIAEACRLLNNKIAPATGADRAGASRAGLGTAGAGRAGAGRAGAGRAGTGPAAAGRAGRAGTGPQTGQNTPTTEPESQSTSDAQLKQAQGIVQGVLSSINARTQPEITALLNDAVKELGIARTIK